jgi:hypothetical protein
MLWPIALPKKRVLVDLMQSERTAEGSATHRHACPFLHFILRTVTGLGCLSMAIVYLRLDLDSGRL